MTAKLAQLTANAMADALDAYANTGGAAKIVIYGSSGGSVPSTADTALTIPSQHQVLATFTCSNPAFGSASSGTITLSGTPLTVAATATGTATFFRIWQNNGTTCVAQGDVGTSGQQLNLNTTSITSGVNVTITSGTINMPV